MSMGTEWISVIVPVYKVEAYLDDCVKSILRQTYTKFELILIDDGSPDQCGKMCDAYKESDTRVRVIHKENGGLSDARNAGLKVASGEYITFIDSDDMISENYLEFLYRAAKKYEADIVQGEFSDKIVNIGKQQDRAVVIYTRDEALEHLLRQKTIAVIACAKLYKKSCFANIEYPKDRINEDNLTVYKNIWRANKVVCIPECIYFYRVNANGIMQSDFSARRFEILSFQKEIEDYLGNDAADFHKLIDYAEMRIAVRLINDCIVAHKEEECCNEMIYAKKVIREYRPDKTVCESKYCWIVWLIRKNYWLYRKFVQRLR